MDWFVYIAVAEKTSFCYTGISPNPHKRIQKHNEGKGSQMAQDQGPFELQWISEPYPNKSEARKREIQIKRWSRKKKKKLITGEWV